jgi:hypothetical protein
VTYTVLLDLHLIYEPLMPDQQPGIVVTREFGLPFVPTDGSKVWSSGWSWDSEPTGLELSEVTWDLDREVFLATTRHVFVDLPLAGIPSDIRDYLTSGWRLCSWMEAYQEDASPDRPQEPVEECLSDQWQSAVDDTTFEHLHTLKSRHRPTSFNRFLKATVRQMAETYFNQKIAYAVDRTGSFMLSQADAIDQEEVSAWKRIQPRYHSMTVDQRIEWMDKVRRYPKLDRMLVRPTTGAAARVAQ